MTSGAGNSGCCGVCAVVCVFVSGYEEGVPCGVCRAGPLSDVVERRCATLPHPSECSTIAVLGLSFRVRNGTGRLPQAMTAANSVVPALRLRGGAGRGDGSGTGRWTRVSFRCRSPVAVRVHCRRSRSQWCRCLHPSRGWVLCCLRPLVPVGFAPCGVSTSGLSTMCSAWGLQEPRFHGILILEGASRLDAFSGYPIRT